MARGWTDPRVDERLATGRVTIDLAAVRTNWRDMAARAPGAVTGAAVKADAYGLGIQAVTGALASEGCRHFFAATPDEGVRAREVAGDSEIFVLGGLTEDNAPFYREAALTPVLNDPGDAALWAEWCRRSGMRRPAALHVDTGMNRLGMTMAEARTFAERNAASHDVILVLVMSHLACGDDSSHPKNAEQRSAFGEIAGLFDGTRASLANSAGVFLGPDYHFDVTRPGIALYGGEAGAPGDNPMRPAVTFEGRILQLRHAKKGETVGYGASTTLTRDSAIAVAGVGYGDGVLRSASGSGVPMRQLCPGAAGWLAGTNGHGWPVPILGRISMDLTAFDVTDVPEEARRAAQWIEIFGSNRPLDAFARAAGTIGYEGLTAMEHRVCVRYSR